MSEGTKQQHSTNKEIKKYKIKHKTSEAVWNDGYTGISHPCSCVGMPLLFPRRVTIIRLVAVFGVVNVLLMKTMIGSYRSPWTTAVEYMYLLAPPPRPPDPLLLCLFTSLSANERKMTVLPTASVQPIATVFQLVCP